LADCSISYPVLPIAILRLGISSYTFLETWVTVYRVATRLKEFARSWYRRLWVLPQTHRAFRSLNVSEAFERIYSNKEWGDGSGSGSSGPAAEKYVDDVTAFIKAHGIRSVVDLGCGDFQVGQQVWLRGNVSYVGVDIVQSLIECHSKRHGKSGISFVCANILTDPLPDADLCLVRQVFQHLSNAQIEIALRNLSKYPLVLVSEHVPKKAGVINRDKPHGPDVRVYWGSGVYLEHPPFSRTVTELWNRPLDEDSLLRTVLLSRPEEQI